MMTRAELAFSALDREKKGYITTKELMKLTKKLSKEELMCLMKKVIVWKGVFNNKMWVCPHSLSTQGRGEAEILFSVTNL